MKNRIAGYRTMLGYTQEGMANIFGITRQAYALKENGTTKFSEEEKSIFTHLLLPLFPNIKTSDIFFNQVAKKYKDNNRVTHSS